MATTMEELKRKAKAYDEAVENMRKFRNALNNHEETDLWVSKKDIVTDIEYYFPELKQSEDEKVRKELIIHCRNTRCVTEEGAERIAKWIAWLEKQSQFFTKKDVDDAYLKGINDAKKELEKQSQQDTTQGSDDNVRRQSTIQVLEYARSLDTYNQYGKADIDKNIAWLEKQVPIDEEKVLIGARKDVALSIMDFLDRNTLGMCLSNMECKDLEDAIVDSDWSKVYDYMKKKLGQQEVTKISDQVKDSDWSEEDEHRIGDTIYFLDTAKKHYASTVELDACIDWLKSLKQRIGG